MKKRIYRKVAIANLDELALKASVAGQRVVLAVDVAKEDMVGVFAGVDGGEGKTVSWKSPGENERVADLLERLLEPGRSVEVAMEASGAYGDVLRHMLIQRGFKVYRVSGKRTHDAAEVFDGVPSLHDAKSAAIIAKLHLDGVSALWPEVPTSVRGARAMIGTMEMFGEHYQRLIHQLEGWLARHWPEVTGVLELTSATLLAMLSRIGGPTEVAANPAGARRLLHGMGHGLLKPEKIEAVIACAQRSSGVPTVAEEHAALRELAEEAHRALKQFKASKGKVEASAEAGPARELAPVTGKATAAVLLADAGDARDYSSAGAYLKAFGLNLKEKSSGVLKGRLSITKRGPSRARKWLWLAVLRWIQKDDLAAAWYRRKIGRDGNTKAKAIVALMRKLVKALFHVARGRPFDSSKLFDATQLKLAS